MTSLVGVMGLMGLACLAPPAHAAALPDSVHTDTVGSARHEWEGPGRCRGAKVRAMQDSFITSFDVSLTNTKGATMQFYAYEAHADDQAYEVVPSATVRKLGSIGDSYGWEASPPINLRIKAQKFYVLLACWDESRYAGYRGAAKIAPQDISLGEYIGGSYFDGGSEPPDLFRPPTATYDYLVRLHSSPEIPRGRFAPYHDTDPFASDPPVGRPGMDPKDPADDGPETGNIEREDAPSPALESPNDSMLGDNPSNGCFIAIPTCGEL
jgi:hypothetical protein